VKSQDTARENRGEPVSESPTAGGQSGLPSPSDPVASGAGDGSGGRRRGLVFATAAITMVFVLGFIFAAVLSGGLGGKGNEETLTRCDEGSVIGQLVKSSVRVRRSAEASSRTVHTFSKMLPYGVPTVFSLGDTSISSSGDVWYKAMMPAKPNGVTGFVPKTAVRLSVTPYRLVVDLSKKQMLLYQGCTVVSKYKVAIGKPSTPTPTGRFYLTGLFQAARTSAYGPYAFSTSAFSKVLTDWPFGGIVGLHGTNDNSSIGRAVTHGCLRVFNKDITRLANAIPVGTPIDIHS
jgi:lipoprotein-anchoring transpeptidase ErfK/SrfK